MLVKLLKTLKFDLKVKRLRYIGHVLNLIVKAYLFGQDASDFEAKFKEQGLQGCRKI
jgi:hypothetical protein